MRQFPLTVTDQTRTWSPVVWCRRFPGPARSSALEAASHPVGYPLQPYRDSVTIGGCKAVKASPDSHTRPGAASPSGDVRAAHGSTGSKGDVNVPAQLRSREDHFPRSPDAD